MKRCLIAFGFILVAYCVVGFLTHSIAWATVASLVVLVVLPPKYDPAVIWKEHLQKPSCYSQYEHRYPHISAERDCHRCPFFQECYDASPFYHHTPRDPATGLAPDQRMGDL